MQYPHPGQSIQIISYKHDGLVHRVWESSTVLETGTRRWIIGNDRVLVKESNGREWRTREPAICTFGKGEWFNTIGMIREDGVYYYCNIGSPYEWKNGKLHYIDYDLDVKVYPNWTYTILDEDEFEENGRAMNYSQDVIDNVKGGLDMLLSMIHQRKGPFEPSFIDKWYERYLQY